MKFFKENKEVYICDLGSFCKDHIKKTKQNNKKQLTK